MKNTFVKVLSMMMALMMVVGMFSTVALAADVCTHDDAKFYGTQQPTCTEPGGDMYRCDCGEVFAKNVVKANGHTLGDKATCVDDQVCLVCGHVAVKATGIHDYEKNADGTLKVHVAEANCAKGNGYYKYHLCKVCGYQDKFDADPNSAEHNLVANESTVKVPTCTEDGEMTYECTKCDYSEVVVIKKYNHDDDIYTNEGVVAEVGKTCTTDGMKAHRYCSICETYFKAELGENGALVETDKAALVIPKSHDKYESSRVEGDCGAGESDIVTYACRSCSVAPWTENVGVVHDYIEKNREEATCTTYGFVYYVCEDCGYMDNSRTEILPRLIHSFYDANGNLIANAKVGETVPQSCFTGEYSVYYCSKCEENVKIYNKQKPQLIHKYSETPDEGFEGYAPTCTATGKTARYTCSLCKTYVGYEDIPALAHKLNGVDQYKETPIAPTCGTQGYTVSKCQLCGDEKAETKKNPVAIDPTKHVPMKDVKPATCDEPGFISTYCKYCDALDKVEVTDPLGHEFTKHLKERDVTATCTTAAQSTYQCANEGCNETTVVTGQKDMSVAGHEKAMGGRGIELDVLREGTCTVKELVQFQCTACGEKYVDNTEFGGEGHTIVANVTVRNANCATEFIGWNADGTYCVECSTFADEATAKYDEFQWVVEPTRNNYAHDEKVTVKKQDATCTAAGWIEFKACQACGENGARGSETLKVAEGYAIAAKGHKDTGVKAATKETCIADGMYAHRQCSVCKAYFLENLGEGNALIPVEKAQLVINNIAGHNYQTVAKYTKIFNNCQALSYVYYECQNECCPEATKVYIDAFKNTNAHNWVVDTDKEGTVNGVLAPTCTTDGHTYYECSVPGCNATNVDVKEGDFKALLHHINADKKTFDGNCNETLEDRKCVREGCGANFNENNEIHTYTGNKVVAATCTTYGYTMKLCANCDEQVIIAYEDVLGHDKDGAVIAGSYVAPTYTTAGSYKYECKCGEIFTKEVAVLAGMDMTITADSAIKAGNAIVNGGKVQFIVKIASYNVLANNFAVEFKYNGSILTFESAEISDIFGEGTINFSGASGAEYDSKKNMIKPDDTLTLISYAPNTADGKVQDIALTGEVVYAVLTFKIAGNATGKAELNANTAKVYNSAEKEATTVNLGSAEMPIVALGNVNDDPAINTADAIAIRKYISGEIIGGTTEEPVVITYKAAADVDKDGDVDLEDFAILNKYLIGAIDDLNA